ncbi:hypothetical protein T484DRAFT_1842502 [Baffinella frigidus]|nr:hypothetical protein T484DRAFT_1842502 [Cryptophyta sp. CCMP2293]
MEQDPSMEQDSDLTLEPSIGLRRRPPSLECSSPLQRAPSDPGTPSGKSTGKPSTRRFSKSFSLDSLRDSPTKTLSLKQGGGTAALQRAPSDPGTPSGKSTGKPSTRRFSKSFSLDSLRDSPTKTLSLKQGGGTAAPDEAASRRQTKKAFSLSAALFASRLLPAKLKVSNAAMKRGHDDERRRNKQNVYDNFVYDNLVYDNQRARPSGLPLPRSRPTSTSPVRSISERWRLGAMFRGTFRW